MNELPEDIDDLEELFERRRIPRRHLRPHWMRLCRSVGLNPKPPLLFSLAEHYRWEGLPGIAIVIVGYLIYWRAFGPAPLALAVLLIFSGLLPLANWSVRRKQRTRLEN